ncbi:Zap1p LALA0_S02e05446g [Lachancea lanzarotensis]|uniref:LALA0S02e05446g1_1 n=1 Tax=Lachancea lanzarotensis TaxID=1245769 RepID=A0A0C7N6N2_9SACH|nr:uncharacterized protein LALA0_S02e05446g [Lachancea lanzarotensis]CEP61042.1 LALA0S02e05446g1_1 [Lachancea lanzarotensis]
MPGSEGIVHGHIHNFNNVTYIHGHVQGSAPLQPDSTSFEQFAQHTCPVGAADAATGAPNLPISPTASAPLPSEQQDSCQLFEFTNCHNLNIFGEDPQQSTGPQFKKRKTFDCDTCEPNIMELCCDEEHEPDETQGTRLELPDQTPAIAFPGSQIYADSVAAAPSANSSLNLELPATASEKLPSYIGCNMTSLPRKSEEDTFYEKFCEQCVDLDHGQAQCSQPHAHSHSSVPTVEPSKDVLNTNSTSHLYTKGHHSNDDDQTLNFQTSQPPPCGHDHSMNSSTDMMVMNDLVKISNMYDFPFGRHFHPHESANDVNVNLLQTSLPISKSGLREGPSVKTPHDHHHHSLELHSHPFHNFYPPSEPSFNGGETADFKLRKPSLTFENLHNAVSPPKICYPEVRNSTVNFNWIYKNEPQNIECGWNNCPEVYNSLLELQSHVLKDHVEDTNTNDTKLPTPRNYLCEWTDCAFEGDDLCTLINHINGEHGVAFDMKFLNREKLLEQNEHQHALHCEECPDFTSSQTPSLHDVAVTPKEDSVNSNNHEHDYDYGHEHGHVHSHDQGQEHVHDCQWNGCGLKFNSCAELNNHIEAVHIPRGRSSYVCEWENCGKTITQRQKLLRHLRVHTRYKPCKCPHCSKTFSTQDILQQHIRTHSGEKPYKCSHCGKGFATSSSLRIHIRTHTGEKPLECKVCGKRFNESSNLSKHMRTHERKYKCNGCKRSFDLAEQLEAHQSRCSHCATFKLES